MHPYCVYLELCCCHDAHAEFVGDNFYKTRRNSTFQQRHPDSSAPVLDKAKDVVSDTANGVIDYGVDTVNNLWDGTSYLYANALEALGFSLGRARATAAEAANLAYDVTSRVYGTAANVAGTAYGVAAGTASTAVNTASNVASTAYGVTANVAGTAYGTAGQVNMAVLPLQRSRVVVITWLLI